MKIKSLLAAVSMVAITAGTAHAVSIPTAATTAAMGSNDVPLVISPDGLVLAHELDLPATFPAGANSFRFAVQADTGTYPAGNNFTALITLPNGLEVDGPINGTVLDGLFFDNDSTNNDRTNDVFTAGAGSATVLNQSGNVIELFISVPQNAGDPVSAFVFDIPVELADCTADTFGDTMTVRILTEGGNNVESPTTATTPNPIDGCASAFDTTFETDIVAGANDTVIGLDDYNQLKNSPGGALVNSSVIGLYSAEIDTNVAIDFNGTPITAASIDEVTADIVFVDGSEITGVTVNGVAGTASTDGNTYSFDLPFGADITDADIIVTVANEDSIVTQDVQATNIIHDLTDTEADLDGTENGLAVIADDGTVSVSDGPLLDKLQREGKEFGFFDWNSGQAGAQRLNVYRITGLAPNAEVLYTITVENAAGLGGADNTLTGSVEADAEGTTAITDREIALMLPATVKQFDFSINLETGTDVDIDRLMSTGGIVTSFNDGANNSLFSTSNQPTGDSDNSTGSE